MRPEKLCLIWRLEVAKQWIYSKLFLQIRLKSIPGVIADENFGNIMANVDFFAKQTARRSIDAFDAPFGREFYQRNREMLK